MGSELKGKGRISVKGLSVCKTEREWRRKNERVESYIGSTTLLCLSTVLYVWVKVMLSGSGFGHVINQGKIRTPCQLHIWTSAILIAESKYVDSMRRFSI